MGFIFCINDIYINLYLHICINLKCMLIVNTCLIYIKINHV